MTTIHYAPWTSTHTTYYTKVTSANHQRTFSIPCIRCAWDCMQLARVCVNNMYIYVHLCKPLRNIYWHAKSVCWCKSTLRIHAMQCRAILLWIVNSMYYAPVTTVTTTSPVTPRTCRTAFFTFVRSFAGSFVRLFVSLFCYIASPLMLFNLFVRSSICSFGHLSDSFFGCWYVACGHARVGLIETLCFESQRLRVMRGSHLLFSLFVFAIYVHVISSWI